MRAVRIVVADGAAVMRAAVRAVLDREKDFLVLEAADLDEALAAAAGDPQPDVALIDLGLPPAGGIAAVRALADAGCAEIIVWGFESERSLVFEAIRAGATGFLHKEISADGLVRALHGVVQGEAPLSRDLTSLMIDALHGLDEQTWLESTIRPLLILERYLTELKRNGELPQIWNDLTDSAVNRQQHPRAAA